MANKKEVIVMSSCIRGQLKQSSCQGGLQLATGPIDRQQQQVVPPVLTVRGSD